MRARYGEFNGKPFRLQSDLGLPDQFMDFILTYGDEALRALRELEQDPEHSEMLRQLLEQGLLEKVKGRFRLTPRAINAMQRKAMMEVFSRLRKGVKDGHDAPEPGVGERLEGTRPFEFGDPPSEIDLGTTLRNAMRRIAQRSLRQMDGQSLAANWGERPAAGQTPRRLLPLRLERDDFERFEGQSRTSCSTVVLLDMSGSMARFGRFFQAKKCAMSLMALIQQRFPLDTIDLVGFFSGAEPIRPEKLPLLMPKQVSMFDPQIRLQVPLNQLERAPQHFTNLHLGLLHARRLLARRGGENKMIFIVTDGQPTAHVQGEFAYLIYPPHRSSHVATLKEALLISRQGVRICTFALTDDYWDMDWLGFVADLGRLTRGVTFQCASGDLSSCVMESYLSGRRRKTFLA